MSATSDHLDHLDKLLSQAYPHSFITEIDADSVPKGLGEDVIRAISARKNEPEFMLAWRLGAYRHWLTMTEPHWGTVRHPPIDYQDIVYYSAPRARPDAARGLDDIDPELLRTYEKLGVPLHERALLAGVAVDAVFDSEAINLVAQSYGRANLAAGDEIVLTEMEHHSNIVPWQILCGQTGAVLRVAPIDDDGELPLERFKACLGPRTRVVAVAHVSNALGTINPLREIVDLAHAAGAVVVVDGAQAAPHLALDMRALDCDFYAFSGHKLYGPTGIGVLYGKSALLRAMPPWQGGGDMISHVSFARTTYNAPPHKFEAGTPDIGGALGLGAALDYVEGVGRAAIAAHERDLLDYATGLAGAVPGLRLIGRARDKAAILSFDHYRRPRNFHPLAGANRGAQGVNPLCGDRIALQLTLDAQGVITGAAFQGAGCAISTASASLMTEQIKGRTANQALGMARALHAMLTGAADAPQPALGKLGVLAGVRAFPSRIKCATLAWHALRAAFEGRGEPAVVSTE